MGQGESVTLALVFAGHDIRINRFLPHELAQRRKPRGRVYCHRICVNHGGGCGGLESEESQRLKKKSAGGAGSEGGPQHVPGPIADQIATDSVSHHQTSILPCSTSNLGVYAETSFGFQRSRASGKTKKKKLSVRNELQDRLGDSLNGLFARDKIR